MDEIKNEPTSAKPTLRSVIDDYLQERLKAKLDKLKDGDDEKRKKLEVQYRAENWIADAARRVSQIQQVTHGIKFLHPDARGSSLYKAGNQYSDEPTVGTHSIKEAHSADVVGNAAALDVYKFLCLGVKDKTILDLAMQEDVELRSVFSDDAELGRSLMAAFSNIRKNKGAPASHQLAKQLYWPLGNKKYHLLAPLFPTALAHVIWKNIQTDRFSDQAKSARNARRADETHPNGYREYPNVVVQKFGGTKPQNISQLNAVRHGENYLLPSCPPHWHSKKVRAPLKVKTVFGTWLERRKNVSDLVHTLRDFLVRVKDVNNVRIRQKRAELVAYICDELLHFAAELHELPGGWSSDKNCRLNISEQCWLDPWRAEKDEAFATVRSKSDWQEDIRIRFANWLNARLAGPKNALHMGEAEAREWRSVLEEELNVMKKELDIHD